jgi:hypothetical protein
LRLGVADGCPGAGETSQRVVQVTAVAAQVEAEGPAGTPWIEQEELIANLHIAEKAARCRTASGAGCTVGEIAR